MAAVALRHVNRRLIIALDLVRKQTRRGPRGGCSLARFDRTDLSVNVSYLGRTEVSLSRAEDRFDPATDIVRPDLL